MGSAHGFDFEDERAALAHDMTAVARAMSRLADLSRVVEGQVAQISDDELADMADRLHDWALAVAMNLLRPALVEELTGYRQELTEWRRQKAEMNRRSPDLPAD